MMLKWLPAWPVLLLCVAPLLSAETGERAAYWVVGTASNLDNALAEKARFVEYSDMEVSVVKAAATAKGKRYRLLVPAAESGTDRELQHWALQFFDVADPWLVTLELPLQVLGGEEQETPRPLPVDPEPLPAPGATAPPVDPQPVTPVAVEPPTQPTTSSRILPQSSEPLSQDSRSAATTLASQGVTAYGERRYRDAIDLYTQAIKVNADMDEIYCHRALAYREVKEFDNAIADYTHAISLNPGYSMAYNDRGVTWRRKGVRERALLDFNKAIELDSANMQARFNRSKIRLLQVLPVMVVFLAN